jgi:hypothetical protein
MVHFPKRIAVTTPRYFHRIDNKPSDTSHSLVTINPKVAIERLSAHASTILLIGYNCTNPLRGNAVTLDKLLDPLARFISGHQRAISLCCCDVARHLALSLSSHLRLRQLYFVLATNQSNQNPRRSTKVPSSKSLALGLRSKALEKYRQRVCAALPASWEASEPWRSHATKICQTKSGFTTAICKSLVHSSLNGMTIKELPRNGLTNDAVSSSASATSLLRAFCGQAWSVFQPILYDPDHGLRS